MNNENASDFQMLLDQIFEDYQVYPVRNANIVQGLIHSNYSYHREQLDSILKQLPGSHFYEEDSGQPALTLFIPTEKPKPHPWALHIGLFIATLFTTTFVGAYNQGVDPISGLSSFFQGLPFSLSILAIIVSHEMGHYVYAKKHGLDATLPFFIPFPTFIGTLGAFIKIRSLIHNRKILMDVGASGPIVGFIVTIPITIYGLSLSTIKLIPTDGQSVMYLGTSILFDWLSNIFAGVPSEGYDVFLHPIAFAGWFGFLLTSLNLLPIGQLDGGHIIYALLGKWQKYLAVILFLSLIVFDYPWPTILLWLALILFLVKIKHPPLFNEKIELDPARKVTGWISVIIFILTFTPSPIQIQF